MTDNVTETTQQAASGKVVPVDIKVIRRAWLEEQKPQLAMGVPGQALLAAASEQWDKLIVDIYQDALGDKAGECALYALGGYGRREMAPYSDVDLMVAIPEETKGELLGRVESFIRTLWAAGIQLGHSVRTPSQCDQMASESLLAACSMLDARRILGTGELVGDLRARIAAQVKQNGVERFLEDIEIGMRARRRKFGDSAHLLEPQVKLSRGGLRDVHVILWVAQVLLRTRHIDTMIAGGYVGVDEAKRLRKANSFMMGTRFALHVHHGWKQDQLTYAAQANIAALMGYGATHMTDSLTRYMQAYHLHARTIAQTANLWLEAWREDDLNMWARRRVSGQFVTNHPRHAIELLAQFVQQGRKLEPSVRRDLMRTAPNIDAKAADDRRANRTLRQIICELEGDPDARGPLRTAADSGILAKVVPEWQHLVGHAVHDVYHVYTTDVHLIATAQRAKSLLLGQLGEHAPYLTKVARRFRSERSTDALILACLLHDIGKGMGADHSIVGAGMASEVARRMGFTTDEQGLIRDLVAEHLTMPKVSQRRDIHDPSTLRTFCATVRDQGFLDALAILSLADMESLGPHRASRWKRHLLAELHRASTSYLRRIDVSYTRGGDESPVLTLRTLLLDEMRPDVVEGILNQFPARFLKSSDLPRLVRAARLIVESKGSPGLVFHDAPDQSHTEVLVIDPAYPGRLAQLAGIIDAVGLDVHRATSFSMTNGSTLAVFLVRTNDRTHRALPERRRAIVERHIIRILEGEGSFAEVLAERTTESTLAPRPRPHVKSVVTIDNTFDDTFTIIEVKSADRPGLLANIAQCLVDLELLVSRSIVITEGDRAIDTFYVVDAQGKKLTPDAGRDVQATVESRLDELRVA